MSLTDDNEPGLVELSLEGVIALALNGEFAAHAFYRQAATQAKSEEARRFLLKLADDEHEHLHILYDYFHRHFSEALDSSRQRMREKNIALVFSSFEGKHLAQLGLVEILSLARWEELKAVALYKKTRDDVSDNPPLALIFERLAQDEDRHFRSLSAMRDRYIRDPASLLV